MDAPSNVSVANRSVGNYTVAMALLPSLGNYASGDRFWDREVEVAEIVGYLSDGESVLLTGPRRVGKTSVARRVLEQLTPTARTAFLDVEQHADPAEMFAGLAAAASRDASAWERIVAWFGRRVDGLSSRVENLDVGIVKIEMQAAIAGSWRDDARAIVAALQDDERPAVVAVDELPLLVDRIMKADPRSAELFMSTLRALTTDYPDVRWLFSGSIGLEAVLHRAGLTATINHLRAYAIDAWDRPTTIGAIRALAETAKLALGDGAAERAHDRLGLGVPYHVQILVDELRRDADRRADRTVTAADVDRVYSGRYLANAVRAHLLHLEARLRTVFGEGDALRLAYDVLTQAAVVGATSEQDAALLAEDVLENGVDRSAVLREVLEVLEHDAYLERGSAGWEFTSRLVRDWWRRGNETGFLPASERRPAP